jgi:ribonuclease D
VQFADDNYSAPNLRALLTDPSILKIFHYARFDMAMLYQYLEINVWPVYCTKIASKLVRTYTDKHGLKDLCREILGVEMSKQQQSSDWGAVELSEDQLNYAASDVLYLHRLQEKLDNMIDREGRRDLLDASLTYLQTRVQLDLKGWADEDIFHH